MPRRHKKTRAYKMRGGLGETSYANPVPVQSVGPSSLDKAKMWWNSASGATSRWWDSASNWVKSKTSSAPQAPAHGGTRKKRAKRGGGFSDNIALTGLAAMASPFSGPTAEPKTIVGGKSRRNIRRRKH